MPFPASGSGAPAPSTPSPPSAPSLPSVPKVAPPFSSGGVIGRAFSVWFRNLPAFAAVTLAVHLPVLVLAALAPVNPAPAWAFADRVVSGLAGLVVTGALTYGVLQSLDGRRVGFADLFRTGFRKMGWVFLVSFAVGLWVMLGTLLLVVPGIVWYCGLYTAVPAVVVEEDLGVSGALSRSRELTKGNRYEIFAVALVTVVATIGGAVIAGVVVGFVGSFLPQPVAAVLLAAVIAVVSSIAACASAVAYHDLRVAKEGVSTAELAKVFE
jgi:hypothetical protein